MNIPRSTWKLSSRRIVVLVMLFGHFNAQIAGAAQPARAMRAQRANHHDVRLVGTGQTLVVRLADDQGRPRVGQPVVLQQGDHVLTQAVTDQSGRATFAGVRGGMYSLTADSQALGVRVWTPAAAPPVAVDELVVTPRSESLVARGQDPWCALFGPEPLLLGVLIAAAIAIPIAVHESGSDDAPPGS